MHADLPQGPEPGQGHRRDQEDDGGATGLSAQLPSDFSPEAVAAIRVRLDDARAQGVHILFAIESGSRAWGFPSPDSDYDCRFVYTQPASSHLALSQPRDVIEFPIEGEIDAGGWDLRKALLLALGGNAVVVEWAKSPLVYEEQQDFRLSLIHLLDEIVDPIRVAHHYLGLARSHISRMGSFASDVKLKKLFYLIRPLVALDWMEQQGFQKLPPMSLPEGLLDTDLPDAVKRAIHEMIATKAETREMGVGPIPKTIAEYLEQRYGHHEMNAPRSVHNADASISRRELADGFYRSTVMRFSS